MAIADKCVSVNAEKHQVEMTLRSGDLDKSLADAKPSLALSDLTPGDNVDGVVKKVELYGLFIEIKDSKISGLCHKSEVRFPFET